MLKLVKCPNCQFLLHSKHPECPHCKTSLDSENFAEEHHITPEIQSIYGAPPWLSAEIRVSDLVLPAQNTTQEILLEQELQALLLDYNRRLFTEPVSFQLEFSIESHKLNDPKIKASSLNIEQKKEIFTALSTKTIELPNLKGIVCTISLDF